MQKHDALMLDLGGVVIDIDFRRVFDFWADRAGADATQLRDRWSLDDAYKAHEVGELSFEQYADCLANNLGIDLPLDDWRHGWNQIFKGTYPRVADALVTIAQRVPLYAYTNTNKTHHAHFQSRFGESLEPFLHIYASSDIGCRKPDTSAFAYVCAQIDVPPERVLFLDDTQDNVDGAARAGLTSRRVRGEDQVMEVLSDWLTAG